MASNSSFVGFVLSTGRVNFTIFFYYFFPLGDYNVVVPFPCSVSSLQMFSHTITCSLSNWRPCLSLIIVMCMYACPKRSVLSLYQVPWMLVCKGGHSVSLCFFLRGPFLPLSIPYSPIDLYAELEPHEHSPSHMNMSTVVVLNSYFSSIAGRTLWV